MSLRPNGGGQVMVKLSLEVPKVHMTIRAYMCGRETLTVERDRERKCNVEAAIVAIKPNIVHTRHKRIAADSKVVTSTPARRQGR